MRFFVRLEFVALAVILYSSPIWCDEPNPHSEKSVAVETLKDGLMAALGENFEYVGGEIGRIEDPAGRWDKVRFWFAKVRPKKAGQYALAHTITLKPSPNPKFPPPPDRRGTILSIKIGKRGERRLILPGKWGGSSYPHANVGDVLMIPIHLHPFGTEHRFGVLDDEHRRVKAFFSVAGGLEQYYTKKGDDPPAAKNLAPDRLELLASWRQIGTSRALRGPSTVEVTAYLEFKQPGEMNLRGRLTDDDQAASGKKSPFGKLAVEDKIASDPEIPFRVVPKDKPVTVLLDYFSYSEYTGQFAANSSAILPHGTIEVRVGDRIVVNCGGFRVPFGEKVDPDCLGTVSIRPFQPVKAFRPDEMKREDPSCD